MDAARFASVSPSLARAEPDGRETLCSESFRRSDLAADHRVDRQWVGPETLGARIVAAARQAVAMHVDAVVREQAGTDLDVASADALDGTQAAALARLARLVRDERLSARGGR